MKKFLCMLSLLLLCAYSGRINAQTESTSSATITFFRTPSSLLPGKFSVSATKKVSFARGNLQYLASRNLWRFAEHQYDMIGNAKGNTTKDLARATQGYWIDYFGWGTSGWAGGDNINAYQPWAYSLTPTEYGPTIAHMPSGVSWGDNEATKNYDWGVYNFTSGPDKGYYVLTATEWDYLLRYRSNADNLKSHGSIFGINGAFLLPDNWDWAEATLAAAVSAAGFTWVAGESCATTKNMIMDNAAGRALWAAMEAAGAVFLPATGYLEKGEVKYLGTQARYHTSTAASATHAYTLLWEGGAIGISNGGGRYYGRTIRLAKPVAGE